LWLPHKSRGKEGPAHMLQMVISNLLGYLRREDEEGQTLVEYGLLLALIAIVVIAALVVLGPIVSGIFDTVGDSLENV
jgi:pilus assembly protein Flp/PilA